MDLRAQYQLVYVRADSAGATERRQCRSYCAETVQELLRGAYMRRLVARNNECAQPKIPRIFVLAQ